MTSEKGDKERRHKRVRAACRVRVVLDSFDDFITRYTNNLSEGGVFIQTTDPRPVGTPLKLDISLRGGRQLVEARGEVVWTRKFDPDQPWRIPGMGIRFTGMSKASRQHLQSLVREQAGEIEEVTVDEDRVRAGTGGQQPSMALDIGCAGVRAGVLVSGELTTMLNQRPAKGEEMPWSPDEPYMNAPRLISRALAKAGIEAGNVVVCTSGWTGTRGREKALQAVKAVGLGVKRIVGASAATVVGGFAGRDLARKVLVYHFGASGFEAVLVEVQGDVFEVKGIASDTAVSGWAVDELVVNHLLEYISSRKGIDLDTGDPEVVSRLWSAAEEAKRKLSNTPNADISLLSLKHGEHTRSVDVTARITRDTLSSLMKGLVDRSIEVCEEVLASTGHDSDSIDDVVLVGGQSRSHAVQEAVTAYFDKTPIMPGQDPELAALLGAGKVAAALSRSDALVLADCVPASIGWLRPGGSYELLMPRGTATPRAVHRQTRTWEQDQDRIRIHVFEGEASSAAGNEYIGSWSIVSIPPGPPGRRRYSVRFEVDVSGILDVSAIDQATGKRHPVVREAGATKEDALSDTGRV